MDDLRGIERIIISIFGGACIFLGYKLFASSHAKQGEVSAQAGKGLRIRLVNVAPGLCFAAFGMAILLMGLLMGRGRVQITDPTTGTVTTITTNTPAPHL